MASVSLSVPSVASKALGSRKFIVFAVVVAAAAFKDKLGLDAAAMQTILGVSAAYLAGQGLADLGKEKGKK